MQREIKFRAWDKKEKIMYKPHTVTNIPIEWGRTYSEGDIFVPRYEFMQFTGLRDSKCTTEYPEGQEIYEGDILAVINPNGEEDELCIVEYDEWCGGYVYEPRGGYGDYDLSTIGWAMTMEFQFEVIGNIWEEPNE